MRLLVVLPTLLSLALPGIASAAPSLKLERMVLLMRHGVRPPTHEPAMSPSIAPDAWPVWEVPDGYLTPHGAAAIALLAAYDREAFAPAAECPDIAIYTDVDERTVKTGQAYADGFAPGCHIVVSHVVTAHDPLFSFSANSAANFDAKTAKAAMSAAAGGDIADVERDNMTLFQAMQEVLEPGGHAFIAMSTKISAKIPTHLPKMSGGLEEASSGAEDFLLEYLDDKPISQVGWGRLDKPGVAKLLTFHPLEYTITARPAYIAAFTAAPLAHRILAGLMSGPQINILVGHDTNIAELGGLLKLHWSLGGYPADDPPPGGGLLFFLLSDAAGAQYVTVSYQVQTMDQIRYLRSLDAAHPPATERLPIPGCGDSVAKTACTLDAFEKLIGNG